MWLSALKQEQQTIIKENVINVCMCNRGALSSFKIDGDNLSVRFYATACAISVPSGAEAAAKVSW